LHDNSQILSLRLPPEMGGQVSCLAYDCSSESFLAGSFTGRLAKVKLQFSEEEKEVE